MTWFWFRKYCFRTSLLAQWLRLHDSNAGGIGSVLGQVTKIPHAMGWGQKVKNKQAAVSCPWVLWLEVLTVPPVTLSAGHYSKPLKGVMALNQVRPTLEALEHTSGLFLNIHWFNDQYTIMSPDPGNEVGFPVLQANSLLYKPPGKPQRHLPLGNVSCA